METQVSKSLWVTIFEVLKVEPRRQLWISRVQYWKFISREINAFRQLFNNASSHA